MTRKREWKFIWLPLLRRPLFTILYVVILSFIAYLGVMHAVEFAILKTETTGLESYYKPIGYLSIFNNSEDIQIEKADIDFVEDN